MCGIAGILLPGKGHIPQADIAAMTGRLVHRGPDGEGYHRERGVALGHRRLNVIDIEGGIQPMTNEDKSVWVTFNGEIYNYRELRSELARSGHRFATNSDTEVLVHGYEEWGLGLLDRLDGMFAFGLWDRNRRRCLLARDPMGQKPLFYAHLADGRLMFGSEAKAVVAHPDVPCEVAESALASYLTFEYLPADQCMFRNVRKLEPGCYLVYESGQAKLGQYWDVPFGDPQSSSLRSACDAFLSAFDSAIKTRLVADVPLGVFLSGGIDSSAVAATVVKHRPAGEVKTFSIGFEDKRFDESDMAQLVADHLGTDHHRRVFSQTDLLDVLPEVVSKLDEPFGDASLLPTYLLSRYTRERVTVALGGDGGDELLLGYPTFKADGPAALYAQLPSGVRRFVRRQANSLPVDTGYFSLDFVIKSFLKAADRSSSTRHPLWMASFVPGGDDDPLHPTWRRQFPLDVVLEPSAQAHRRAPDQRRLQRLSYQYCKTYLAEDILVKVDRASMAVSLEARSPFLDKEVVRILVNAPPRLKLFLGVRAKHLLKQAMAPSLPKAIVRRKKRGFAIPVADWLRGPLKEQMLDLLSFERIKRTGLMRPEVVSRLVEEHLKERRDNRKQLWTLMSFELWREKYGIGV